MTYIATDIGEKLFVIMLSEKKMASPLGQEFEYYLANQQNLVSQYDGKFVVIKDHTVIGVYDDQITAINETQKSHKVGTFLVQRVLPGDTAYSQTFHSRVSFH